MTSLDDVTPANNVTSARLESVVGGACTSDCDVIYVFSVLFLIMCLTTFMTGTASQTATIRFVTSFTAQHSHIRLLVDFACKFIKNATVWFYILNSMLH